MRLYTARWLLPAAGPPVRDGAVAVDPDGWIAYVGPAAGAPPGDVQPLGDAALLPGLVAHAPPDAAPSPAALRARRRLHADAAQAFLVLLAAVAYALVVGVVRSGPVAPAAGVLTWLPPLAVGLHVATSPAPTAELRR